jgi:hypothetical protein
VAIREAQHLASDMPSFMEQLGQRGYVVVTSERTAPNGKRRVGIVYGKEFAGGTERWVSGSAIGAAFTHRGLLTFFEQKQAEALRQTVSPSLNSPALKMAETPHHTKPVNLNLTSLG